MNWVKWFFDLNYRFRHPPWDTGITPPELVATVTHGEVKPGRALDLGCGTGTNSIYLAQHGFRVTGIDFSPQAIEIARSKAGLAGADIQFRTHDVTRLDFLDACFALVLDIGCFHGLSEQDRARYADNVKRLTCPGGLYMLYAFGPRPGRLRRVGVSPQEVEHLFGDQFLVKRQDHGSDRGERASTWYWLVRR